MCGVGGGGECHRKPSPALQVSVFLQRWRKWSKNDGVFVFWHFVSLRAHQGWASPTSSVNLGLLPSVSLSAARLGGGKWALAENDPSGLIVFWPADWHWEEKQRHREKERGVWVLMHLAAIREAYLTVWAQHANTHIHSVHTVQQHLHRCSPTFSTPCTPADFSMHTSKMKDWHFLKGHTPNFQVDFQPLFLPSD